MNSLNSVYQFLWFLGKLYLIWFDIIHEIHEYTSFNGKIVTGSFYVVYCLNSTLFEEVMCLQKWYNTNNNEFTVLLKYCFLSSRSLII